MLQASRSDVRKSPFPHVLKEGMLPPELYAALRADFPTASAFDRQVQVSGSTGSRVGNGFDIYRGDPEYSDLIARSEAWKSFDSYINSPQFVQTFLDLFGPDLNELGCVIDVRPDKYRRDHIEPRSALTRHKGMRERFGEWKQYLTGAGTGAAELFTRLDIEKSVSGYAKPPHCDRPNRLCSLIIYFVDADRAGLEGGELNIYAHKKPKSPIEHERHPKQTDVEVVATVKPKENLGVFFPCSNNSYHGVNAIRSVGVERDFLYINISTVSASCWK